MIPWRPMDPRGERLIWTAEHRQAVDRDGLRYPSDPTEAEGALVAHFRRIRAG